MKTFIAILVIAILIVLAIYYFRDGTTTENNNETVFCSMDAKLCPDGSYVGRVPPDCEFQMCPSSTTTSTSPANIDINADINAS